MEILTQQLGDGLEVKVRGRLDNYWTEHLQRNIEEVIRGGAHVIWLNLSEVSYLSSAGVGLLVKFHRQLKGIGGNFAITHPSEHVKLIVDLCRLSAILFSEKAPSAPALRKAEVRRFSSPAGLFEVLECMPEKPLLCQRIGNAELFKGCRFAPQECRTVKFPQTTFGFGLGAFGHGYEDAQSRFGEFLAVGGSAAYLPTDGTNVPDFMVSSGDLVPEMNMLYGVRCEGGFTHLLRFEATSATSSISLTELVQAAMECLGTQTIGMVMVAESAGMVGAALRRSPAAAGEQKHTPFHYPEVRTWLSFSMERLYSRSLALVTGIVAGSACPPLASLLRPLRRNTALTGHFHAAAFSYRPLQKGEIDLKTTVTSLFETESLQGVLHLLTDNREAAGPQESEFVRGACWISAAAEIQ